MPSSLRPESPHIPSPHAAPSPLVAALVHYYDELVDYIRRRFGDVYVAQDVVHDVCLQLLEAPVAVSAHTPLAFLRHISVHRAIDRYRYEAIRCEPANMAEPTDMIDRHGDGAAALHFTQTISRLQCVIDTLPPRCREVFLLHKVHEMPQHEVAVQLNISRNMVAKHMARAMKAIEPVL